MSGRNLPYKNLELMRGLATSFSPETTAGAYLRVAVNVDGYDRFRGLGQIPGSTRLNPLDPTSDPTVSLNFFEFIDLDRISKRKLLLVEDTLGTPFLRELDLDTGLVGGIDAVLGFGERLFQAEMNNRLHLSSPNQWNGPSGRALVPTGGVKFDGTKATNWGVKSPGSTETLREGFEDFTDWTETIGAPDITLSDESTNVIEGQNALNIDVINAGSAQIRKTFATENWDPDDSRRFSIWVFVPSGGVQALPSTSAFVFELSSDNAAPAAANTATWVFSAGAFLPGWNVLELSLDDPDATVGGSFDPTDVELIYIGVGEGTGVPTENTRAALTGLIVDFLSNLDPRTVQIGSFAEASSGNDDALVASEPAVDFGRFYRYVVTFVTEFGLESNAGGATDNDITVETTEIKFTSAQCDISFTTQPNVGDTLIVDGIEYTFQLNAAIDPTVEREIGIDPGGNTQIGLTGTATNIANALRADPATGGNWSLATLPHPSVRASVASGTATPTGNLTLDAGSSDTGPTVWKIPTTKPGTLGNLIEVAFPSTMVATVGGFGIAQLGTDTKEVNLTNIPVPTDAQVTSKVIYRDEEGDGVFREVVELTDISQTTYTDSTPQNQLGVALAPFLGDENIDNAPPVPFSAVEVFESRVFGVDAETGIVLYISEPNQPEQFPLLNQLVFSEPITALRSHTLGLFVYTTDNLFLVDANFGVTLVNTQLGANGPETVARAKGLNIVVREKEVFLVRSPLDAWYISGAVQKDLDDNWDSTNLKDQIILHDRSRFRFVFFTKDASGDYTRMDVWQYGSQGFQQITGDGGAGSGTDPQDLRVGAWFTMVLPVSGLTPLCATVGERSADEPELWVGTDEGFVHHFQPGAWGDVPDWDLVGGAQAVSSAVEVQPMPLGDGEGGRGEVRYLKLNGDFTDPDLTFGIDILNDANGSVVKAAGFSKLMTAANRSLILPVPGSLQLPKGEWARISIANSTLGSSWRLSALGFYHIPRSDFRGAREDG